MATLTELKITMEDALNDPHLKPEIYARPLRKNGLLTSGGRGRNAPQMTATDCANLLIAIMASAPAYKAVETVKRYKTLRLLGRRPGPRGHRTTRPQRIKNLVELPLSKIRDVHFFDQLVEILILRSADGSIGRLAAEWPDGDFNLGFSLRVIGPRPAAVLRIPMPKKGLTLAYGIDDDAPSTPAPGLVRAGEIHEDVLIALGELFR